VALITEHAFSSAHVSKEIERASAKRRPIIALRLDQTPLPPAFEYFLSESHWLTVVHGDVEALAPAVSQGVRHLCVGVRPQGGVSSRLASARQTDRAKVKRQKNAQIELPASVKTITSDHFEASAESDNARSFLKYRIRRDAYFLSFSDVFQLWEQDTYFVDFYISVFEQSGYYGYIWETPAISTKSLDDTFEFVIHALPKSSGLPDHGTYAGYFDTETAPDGIVSFQNLGGDALLIVPSPYRPTADYSGLAEFFREAPLGQQRRLWCELGRHAKSRLSDRPVWLSVSGGGIQWLHLRIDSTPKYYRYGPYTTPR
jgi:hypothetical protein